MFHSGIGIRDRILARIAGNAAAFRARGKPLFACDKARLIVTWARKAYIWGYVVLASLSDEALLSF